MCCPTRVVCSLAFPVLLLTRAMCKKSHGSPFLLQTTPKRQILSSNACCCYANRAMQGKRTVTPASLTSGYTPDVRLPFSLPAPGDASSPSLSLLREAGPSVLDELPLILPSRLPLPLVLFLSLLPMIRPGMSSLPLDNWMPSPIALGLLVPLVMPLTPTILNASLRVSPVSSNAAKKRASSLHNSQSPSLIALLSNRTLCSLAVANSSKVCRMSRYPPAVLRLPRCKLSSKSSCGGGR